MKSKDAMDIEIRWLIRRDLRHVLQIDKDSFFDFWDEDVFLTCLRQRNYIGLVVESGDEIVGFVIYELRPHSLHIVRMAVSPEHRELQIGTRILTRLKDKLSQQRRDSVQVDVHERNLGGQLFLKKNDFCCVKIDDDMYLMRYSVNDGAGFVPKNRISEYL